MKLLRFDNCSTRREKRQKDKFCLISETWNNFIENYKKCYVPSFNLTIDKQLFPCKTQCPSSNTCQNNPDNFVLKFWLLVKVRLKHLCNSKPYFGKYPIRNRENNFPTDVCLWLKQTFLKKRYNVTIDNYFTSINLADKRKAEKLHLLDKKKAKKRSTKS